MRYRGHVAWVNQGDLGVPESGFYALTKDGRSLARPLRRLVAVQHRFSSKHHYRDAREDEHSPPPGRIVGLSIEMVGKGEITA